MKKPNVLTAFIYYLQSIPTIFRIKNFWVIPFVYFFKPVILELDNGLKYSIESLMDVWVIKEIILDRQYEYKREVKKDDVVIDIGAAFGDFSIFAAKTAKKVYAFDPNLKRIEQMKKNMVLNNIANIKVYGEAVTDLNNLFREKKITKCNFLKIDCEGAEYQILQKASEETLSKVEYIAFEIHLFTKDMKKRYPELKKMLEKNGFTLSELENPVHPYLKQLFALRKG